MKQCTELTVREIAKRINKRQLELRQGNAKRLMKKHDKIRHRSLVVLALSMLY